MTKAPQSAKPRPRVRSISTDDSVEDGMAPIPAHLAVDKPTEPSSAVPNLSPIAVSMRDASKISGLSRSFLYEEIGRQRLKSIKKRGRRLILLDDLKQYLNSRD